MSFTRGSSTLLGSMIRYQPSTRPVVSSPIPKVPTQTFGQRIIRKPKSIIESLKASHTQPSERRSSGTGLTFGAALLMGGTILMAPLKEGSPAKVILTSSEHLLNSRRTKPTGLLAMVSWARVSWILAQVWTLIITILIWWRLGRMSRA